MMINEREEYFSESYMQDPTYFPRLIVVKKVKPSEQDSSSFS